MYAQAKTNPPFGVLTSCELRTTLSARDFMRTVDTATIYELRIRGHLGLRMKGAFAPLHPHRYEGEVTVLRGEIPDQAALHGILRRVAQNGLDLLSLTCVCNSAAVQVN